MQFTQADTFERCTHCRRLTKQRAFIGEKIVPRCNPEHLPCLDRQTRDEVTARLERLP